MPTLSQEIRWATTMWRSNVASPYMQAYNDAYKSVEKILQEEKDDAKAQAELFATVVAILPVSVLMAVVTTARFTKMAQRIAVRRLGANNLRVALSYLKSEGPHPVVAFAFGELKDAGKDLYSDKMKALIPQLVQNTSNGVTATDPFSRDKQLTSMIDIQGMMVERYATAILEDGRRSPTDKQQRIALLKAAPFLGRAPSKTLSPEKLRPYIELAMLMNVVMDRDYLRLHYPLGTRVPSERAGGINAMPSDPNYPKSQNATAMSTWTTVEVDRPSNGVQEQIDKVHKEVFNTPFYTHGRYLGMQWPGGKTEELLRAENVFKKMSKLAVPKALNHVCFV